jgi:hypothetical protein
LPLQNFISSSGSSNAVARSVPPIMLDRSCMAPGLPDLVGECARRVAEYTQQQHRLGDPAA